MQKWFALALLSVVSVPAVASDINVLSGGAVEPGLAAAAETFRKESGIAVNIKYATAPAIRQRIDGGEAADVVIAPPAIIDELAKAGKLTGEAQVPVGRVGVGVIVRAGAATPDISSTEALKRALLEADSVVYNRASTGLYLEKMLERIGIAGQIKPKETRYPDGAAVLDHIIKGSGKEIGFGAITEIMLYRSKPLQYVGPLPAELQNYTSYVAAPAAAPANAAGAADFLKFLRTPAAKAQLVANGVE